MALAAASKMVFTNVSVTLTAGVTSGNLTIQLEDSFGNFTNATSPQTITLGTTSTGPAVFAPTSLSIAANSGSASFTYNDQKAGTPTITATDSGLTTTTVSQTETVNAAAASQMVFTTVPQTLTAGVTSGTLTIQLEDQFGNFTNATSPQAITLSTTSTGPAVFAPTSLSIASGSGSATFTYNDQKAGTPTLTATDGSLTTTTVSQMETVNAAAASQMVFTTVPQTLTAGVTSGTLTVQLEDSFGNVSNATSAQTILISTTSSGGQFRDNTTGTTQISFVTISSGSSTASFKYNDTLAGSPMLTATDNALSSPTVTQTETVNAAAASKMVFTNTPLTLTAGLTSGNLTIQLEDQFGNFTNAGTTQTISLATTSTGPAVFAPTSLTINSGSGSATFTYNDQKAGTPMLTATDSALTTTTVSQTETVNAAAASQMVFTTAPQTLTTGVTSGPITVQLEDQFGNFTNATSPQTITLSTTSTGPAVFNPTSLTINSGSGKRQLHVQRPEGRDADHHGNRQAP